ncbi:MAG: hypothetical protein IT442_09645 [Phycisphaeraceae bacterium]|nr:hypothetical protein [Phycisphaeraceae bacterium]
MATTASYNIPSAWHDRWTEPTPAKLVAGLSSHHRKAFDKLAKHISELEGVRLDLIWYGPSWKWTLRALLPKPYQGENVLCYLVPDPVNPLICVPVPEDLRELLLGKRLRKYIREGLIGAKRAVHNYWATWLLLGDAEAEMLMDLAKRKHAAATGKHAQEPVEALDAD